MSTVANSNEEVELIIPPFLENSLGCFTTSKTQDVSHLYNIKMRTPKNKELYVRNEEDLRDVLKHYVIYKQLCQKIEKELITMKQEMEKSKQTAPKITPKSTTTGTGATSTPVGKQKKEILCEKDCLRVSHATAETQTEKKRCCILL